MWRPNGCAGKRSGEKPNVNTSCRVARILQDYHQLQFFLFSVASLASMATLNDDPNRDHRIHSTHILSPQPCAPPNKEHFIASLETSHLPSAPGSVIDDGQMSIREDEYTSSGSSTRHSTSDVFGREMDDELEQMKSRASSRSSVSSLPGSVLVHPLDQKHNSTLNMHDKIAGYTIEDDEASFGGFESPPPRNIRTIRQREGAFRKPSSVRAMQMDTEDEANDDEYLTPPRRRHGMRSPGSSPLKRSPYYSPNASSSKPKVKKEYPLVLLHCNLLAPSLPVSGASEPHNQKIVEEVLPTQYWKRWRRLQEKAGSGVLRDRGVLISHPEDLYDMLEERLLESLELQRSRLDHGHFMGHEESGPGSEGEVSDQGESETDGEQGEECPDCGGRVLRHSDSNRKWEIRVFAANGLMRAGAWAAAWKEMEKVDVEVGVWLPSDVRRTLQKRLAEENLAAKEAAASTPVASEVGNPAADLRSPSIGHTRAFSNAGSVQSAKPSESTSPDLGPTTAEARQERKEHQVPLPTLAFNYIRVLAGDRRNIALVLMSVLVVFLAIGARPDLAHSLHGLHSIPGMGESLVVESPVVSSLTVAAPLSSAASPSASMAESIQTPAIAVSIPASEPVSSSSADEPARPFASDEPASTMEQNQSAPIDVESEVEATKNEEEAESVEMPTQTSSEFAVPNPETTIAENIEESEPTLLATEPEASQTEPLDVPMETPSTASIVESEPDSIQSATESEGAPKLSPQPTASLQPEVEDAEETETTRPDDATQTGNSHESEVLQTPVPDEPHTAEEEEEDSMDEE